ncbi:hypothetical protein [Streptomyces sp. NPDC001137]|uniref:hypothetical protein n=1 Tax=Streptomyces sp. NPDC001137 TaxID=3154378 RepID=UPI003316572D
MSEWVTAVIGLLGAAVGTGAAIWGAQRQAKASADVVAVQMRREDERWMRDQRQAAYHAMLQAEGAVDDAALALRTLLTADHQVPPEQREITHAATRGAYAALTLIQLCGPQTVREAARRLRNTGDNLLEFHLRSAGRPEGGPALTLLARGHALRDFQQAATEALGYDSLD